MSRLLARVIEVDTARVLRVRGPVAPQRGGQVRSGATMSLRRPSGRAAPAMLAVLLLGVVPAPGSLAASGDTTCLVRNVTRHTTGGSFGPMVVAAHGGDQLQVRGSCRSSGVRISKDLVIRGIGDGAALRARAGSERRVLSVTKGASVALHDMIVEGGSLDCPSEWCEFGGAGILNLGRLTLVRVVVQGNGARDVVGLAIRNRGTLVMRHSVVRNNRGLGDSDAAISNVGTLVMLHSQVRDNDQAGIDNGGVARLVDSVVSGHRRGDWAQGIYNSGRMTLIRSTIRDNRASSWMSGGGIANLGTLTVRDSVIRNNRATGEDAEGGGFWNEGRLTVVGSVIRDNTARWAGGGISNWGTLRVRDSVIRDNHAASGAGLWNSWDGDSANAIVERSRIVGNRSGDRGGGIWNLAELNLVDTVVRGNRASQAGGGIDNGDPNEFAGTLTIDAGSRVTGNAPDDCVGTSAC